MENEEELRVVDDQKERRFEAYLGKRRVAYSEYDLEPERIVFTHTVVRPEFEGQGIGSRLAKFALDDARSRGLRITPVCQFVRTYLRRHHDYDDVVDFPSPAPD